MRGSEILFLTGLGIVCAVAFAVARNLLVLWPLLTPMGSLFVNLVGGDIDLPWASIAGFVDVRVLMLAALWLADRHERRRVAGPRASPTNREIHHRHAPHCTVQEREPRRGPEPGFPP